MHRKSSPIGIIDSGIGGYSVVRTVQRLLPREDVIYLGDGANTPYGNHSRAEILAFARHLLIFMRQRQVKALLVACNTVSCLLDVLCAEMDCPCFSIIDAGAEAACALRPERLLVLSSCYTARTRSYPKRLARLAPGLEVYSRGSRDLAGLIERYLGREEGAGLIDACILQDMDEPVHRLGVDACVLGCTHYPLIETRFQTLFPQVTFLDPAYRMAERARQSLDRCGLLREGGEGRLFLYTTGSVEDYAEKARAAGLHAPDEVGFVPPLCLSAQSA